MDHNVRVYEQAAQPSPLPPKGVSPPGSTFMWLCNMLCFGDTDDTLSPETKADKNWKTTKFQSHDGPISQKEG